MFRKEGEKEKGVGECEENNVVMALTPIGTCPFCSLKAIKAQSESPVYVRFSDVHMENPTSDVQICHGERYW